MKSAGWIYSLSNIFRKKSEACLQRLAVFQKWLGKLFSTACCHCCRCCTASVVSDSVRPHRRQPTRLPRPWDSPGKNTGVGCHFFSNAWKWKVKVRSLSRVRLFVTPWTAAHQAPPSMGFSRQEYWSGVPLPSPYCLSSRNFPCVVDVLGKGGTSSLSVTPNQL